jgi:hypothetical protein
MGWMSRVQLLAGEMMGIFSLPLALGPIQSPIIWVLGMVYSRGIVAGASS